MRPDPRDLAGHRIDANQLLLGIVRRVEVVVAGAGTGANVGRQQNVADDVLAR